MSVGQRDEEMNKVASIAAEAFCEKHTPVSEAHIKEHPETFLEHTIPYLTVRTLHELRETLKRQVNCRAATPNAIRVSVINDRVDPVSGTLEDTRDQDPGARVTPNARGLFTTLESPGERVPPPTDKMDPAAFSTSTSHTVIAPVGPVANRNAEEKKALRFVMVCTPSESVKAVGVTLVNPMFGARGPANVTVADTKSLVV
jgi:hypothetical protein